MEQEDEETVSVVTEFGIPESSKPIVPRRLSGRISHRAGVPEA